MPRIDESVDSAAGVVFRATSALDAFEHPCG
jgi:hypothetical protein